MYIFLPKLLNMSITASVVIVFVLIIRIIIRKAPKVFSYALWGIVLFRLLCPISIKSEFSLFAVFKTPITQNSIITSSIEYVPTDIVHAEYPSVILPVPFVSEVINETLPKGQEQIVADPLESPVVIATYIWIIGVFVMAIYAAITYIRLKIRLITASKLVDNIYLADEITYPFVMGLFKPKIYLPSSLGEHEQGYIIMHEKYHIKRFDHIVKLLAFAVLCIHWFNPFVWLAFVLASKDMEMSCDEAVVNKMGDDIIADYASSLLSLATGKRTISGVPLAFGEGDTKERIKNLANIKKTRRWITIISIILCAVIAVCLLTNPELDFNKSNIKYTKNIAEMSSSEIIEDLSYYLEFASSGIEFQDMETGRQKDILYEYSELLDNYLLLPRESKDGNVSYIIGVFRGDNEDSPFYSLNSMEYSDSDTDEMIQLLYKKNYEEKVNQALATSQITDFMYAIKHSRIYYIPENGIIMIEPNDTSPSLAGVFTKYFEPNGKSCILDAVSRGISVTTPNQPYLNIYLISEKYGEVTETIALSEQDAAKIMTEDRELLTNGSGFTATLHKDDEVILFSEIEGIPSSVIDLAIEKCGYKFEKPSDITGSIVKARLDCEWIDKPIYAKEEDLERLKQILTNAKYDDVNGCGYKAKLTIELSNGKEMVIFKGCDDCDTVVFGSYGGYVIGEKENQEFWKMFGLDAHTKNII